MQAYLEEYADLVNLFQLLEMGPVDQIWPIDFTGDDGDPTIALPRHIVLARGVLEDIEAGTAQIARENAVVTEEGAPE